MDLHIGLIINPLAGLGGSLALKGSDGAVLRDRLGSLDVTQRQRAAERTTRALRALCEKSSVLRFTCCAGEMGEGVLRSLGVQPEVLGKSPDGLTSARDTKTAARQMLDAGVDIIVFVGGDGTARDIFDVIGTACPVLGVPAGVKMHSGVFALSPEAAGELLLQLVDGGLVGLRLQEVRDIDEEAFRHDVVRSRYYGEMQVPGEGRFLQHTKIGGRESEELAAAEIAAWIVEIMEPGRTYLIGPGSTTAAIMAELGLDNTLLGVDAVRDGRVIAADADELALLGVLEQQPDGAEIIVTAIGGQGHIFGRGNQQFSPAVIRAVGRGHVTVVATRTKIVSLEGRALLVDTNDPALDRELCGYYQVVTGYDDHILYRVANNSE